jgi:hypothetical protein
MQTCRVFLQVLSEQIERDKFLWLLVLAAIVSEAYILCRKPLQSTVRGRSTERSKSFRTKD